MGRITIVKQIIAAVRGKLNYKNVQVDKGAGDTVTAPHFAPPGDDSVPLPDDTALIVELTKRGVHAACGYMDGVNTPVASPGEKRIYARNSDGAIVSSFYMKNDSSVTCSNGIGFFTLGADGVITLNGVTIDPNGKVTSPTSIHSPSMVVGGTELDKHTHGGVDRGSGDTDPL